MKTCAVCGARKELDEFHIARLSPDGHTNLCKPCACSKTAAWKAANPDRAKAAGRLAYERSKAIYKARATQWARTNTARRLEIRRASAIKPVEKKRASSRAYNRVKYYEDLEASRVKVRAAAKAFRRKNPQAARAIRRRTKARRQGAVVVGRIDYQAIRVRDRMRCHLCGKRVFKKDLQFDHVIPLAKGGEHSQRNLAVSHSWCNLRKRAHVLTLF